MSTWDEMRTGGSTGRKCPELLMPAANPEVLRTAVIYGADAVYIGGEAFSLRAKADNFTLQEMEEGIAFAHEHGVKVYVTVNIFAHNRDLPEAEEYLKELGRLRPDALLIADPGLFAMAKRLCPETDLHISTQANNVNYETFRFWHELGAKRVVAGRELSLAELSEIKERLPEGPETEAIVHGAMCISYSGRCLLSNYLTGRDANQGECTHPCRWKYHVYEEGREGEYFPVEENDRGTYIFASKDLCMIEHLPELLAAGIDSLKVEGRMKTELYVATVARAYRMAIDALLESPERYRERLPFYKAELTACTYRDYCTGFFFGRPDESAQNYEEGGYRRGAVYLGTVQEVKDGLALVIQKNKLCVGESAELIKPGGENIDVRIEAIYDEEGSSLPSAPHPKQRLYLKLSGAEAKRYDILRRRQGEES